MPPGKLGGYVRDLRALMDSHGLKGAMYGHFGQGCIHSPHQLRPADRRRDRQLPRVHGRSRRPGHLLRRHAVGRARRRPAARRAAREAVRPRADPGDARVQADLGPGLEDEPGQGRRPVPDGREPQAGHRLQPGRARSPGSPTPRTRATSRTPRCAAWASASAATRRARPPCAPATRSPGRRSTAPGGGPGCCSRCSGARSSPTAGSRRRSTRRSTCAWPARAAPATARWAWTCPPTSPSSSTTITSRRAAGGRAYAYAFGYIDKAARLASLAPEVVNFATQTPGPAPAGASWRPASTSGARCREFAPMTLQQWFKRRGGTANPYGRPVVLFPDTFNNYFHADVGVACVEAIEAAGWRVIMPDRHVCCGRPLYDYGFLDSAGRYLRRVLDELRPYVRDGRSGGRDGAELPGRLQGRAAPDAAARRRRRDGWPATPTTSPSSSPRSASSRRTWKAGRCCGGTAITGPPAASSRSSSCCSRWA